MEEDDDVFDDGNANCGGGAIVDFGGFRKTLIFIGDEEETRSYSSIRFARSSSEVTETSASRSSVGSWHRIVTVDPHISVIFDANSVTRTTRACLSFFSLRVTVFVFFEI